MWEKRIVNTNLKCIAVNSKDVNSIIKQIKKGNYVSFIDTFLPCWDNLTLVHIMGKLICEIKEFDEFKSRLLIYSKKVVVGGLSEWNLKNYILKIILNTVVGNYMGHFPL